MKRHRLFRDWLGRRGIAAVEFAIVVPVLLVLFIGTIEILTLYRTEAKLNALAFNVAQMVSIEATPVVASASSGTSLNDICQGAILGLQPFPPGGLTIDVASVTLEPSASGANTAASTPAYDIWEGDSIVTGQTCSTPGSGATAIGATQAKAYVGSTATGMLQNPCDNIVIVTANLVYPGITGLILRGIRPTLTQTAYSRWRYSSPTTQLLCSGGSSGCTLTPATPLDYCNASNTAVH